MAVGEVSLSKFMRGRMPGRSIFGSNDGAGRACSSFSTTQPRAARLGPRKALASHRCSQTPTEVRDQHHYQRAETQTRMHPPSTAGWTRSRSRVLVNSLLLLLPLRRDQRVRIPVSVHARSFPATIRETSSRPNRHLCHRGSNNDSDRGCKISTLPGHFSARRQEPLRSGCTSISFRLSPDPFKVKKPQQQPPERLLKGIH